MPGRRSSSLIYEHAQSCNYKSEFCYSNAVFQYQRLIKVFPSFSLQIFSRKAVVMAAIITLSVFPVNVFADKDTRVTERSADQVITFN